MKPLTTGATVCVFIFLCAVPFPVISLRTVATSSCDRASSHLRTVRSDQITVLINGYSESRIPLLRSIAATYASSPSVSAVLVLWGNPSTPTKTLAQLSHNLSASYFGGAPISVIRQSSTSLNSRFLPQPSIKTRGVLICDDDVEIDSKSIEFAFKIWGSNRDRLVGFFTRSHDLDLSSRTWIYTVHPDRYSILLTKFMILKLDYLYNYSCDGGGSGSSSSAMNGMRKVVDEMRNCEDILMNFVVANGSNAGPIMVGAEKVRDWGDARNEDRGGRRRGLKEEREGVKEVGLSSRGGDHRKRRGECIREFHRIMGRVPLRYSYGKVVNSVGEQGLCEKGGRLVFCDQQVGNSWQN